MGLLACHTYEFLGKIKKKNFLIKPLFWSTYIFLNGFLELNWKVLWKSLLGLSYGQSHPEGSPPLLWEIAFFIFFQAARREPLTRLAAWLLFFFSFTSEVTMSPPPFKKKENLWLFIAFWLLLSELSIQSTQWWCEHSSLLCLPLGVSGNRFFTGSDSHLTFTFLSQQQGL